MEEFMPQLRAVKLQQLVCHFLQMVITAWHYLQLLGTMTATIELMSWAQAHMQLLQRSLLCWWLHLPLLLASIAMCKNHQGIPLLVVEAQENLGKDAVDGCQHIRLMDHSGLHHLPGGHRQYLPGNGGRGIAGLGRGESADRFSGTCSRVREPDSRLPESFSGGPWGVDTE